MKYGLYSIRDKVAECGGYPFVSRNNGTAARVFRDFIQRQQNTFAAEEHNLIMVGIWDEETCKIEPCEKLVEIQVAMPPTVGKE